MRIIISLLVAATAASALAYGQDGPDIPSSTWWVRNDCREIVRIAVHCGRYVDLEDNRWPDNDLRYTTRGWWRARPGETIGIACHTDRFGYVAMTQSRAIWWWNPEGERCEIEPDSERFDRPCHGSDAAIGMHWLTISSEAREPDQARGLTCD